MVQVSVIIPVYKVEPYLERCVQSVYRQTFKDMEIIMVDDGSPDNSGKLADQLASQDSRARVIHQENQGISSARNTGLRAAQGEFVIFLDSDDEWLINDGLERMLSNSPKDCDLIVFNKVDVWKGGAVVDPTPDYDLATINSLPNPQAVFSYLIKSKRFCVTAWSVIVRKSLLIENNILFPVGIVAEDVIWSLHVWQVVKSVSFQNLGFYGWHHRPGSITQSTSIRNYRSNDIVFTHLEEQCKNNCVNREAILAFLANRWVSSGCNYHRLTDSEKEEALDILDRHKGLLDHSFASKGRISAVCVKILGVKNTCILLGAYRGLRMRIKHQSV